MTPTWITILTPPGQGALASLGLHGPAAWDLACALFRPRTGALPASPELGWFRLGRISEGSAEALGDEVVLAVKSLDPPTLELHCHGGRVVVGVLQDLFTSRGAQACSWDDWLRLTTPDPLQAEATVALTRATTPRTAAILLDQHAGAWRRLLDTVQAALDRHDIPTALAELQSVRRWSPLGRHLTTPWRVVVAGPPNVGKSSLVNALAGYERCVVADTPGTTRDVVATRLALDGWPVELVDTAGLRSEAETLEGQGMTLARTAAGNADLVLWVVDGATALVEPDVASAALRIIVNKADLPSAWSADPSWPRVSARTGEGVGELATRIAGWLVPEAPPAGAAVPFTPELGHAVEKMVGQLAAGQLDEARDTMAAMGGGT